ncbi:NTP transferase domain-containing protein [Paracoccus sp. S-4012]|uniref:nucleotidyltransferase family protein n=1 Tax=Paracoccus sp. S-4012 TaxID=2665648 RepID=UPI0012B0A56F|nr:NTP transferase domain-containing protein [Paracoccus sp. S-4012]MRX48978.1 NTP transferase domain-containing protein [Paracoccus sp. S-4012]
MMRVAGVLLAAGHSRRWGAGEKLLADWQGRPLVTWAAAALGAARVDHRAAVVRAPQVAAALPGLERLVPDEPDEGQAASLRAAVRHAEAVGARKLLILLGDMPRLRPETLDAVVAACGATPAAVRHPDGRPGVPACFPATMFSGLLGLSGDRGAGALLAEAAVVEVAAEELLDIDRPADLHSSPNSSAR